MCLSSLDCVEMSVLDLSRGLRDLLESDGLTLSDPLIKDLCWKKNDYFVNKKTPKNAMEWIWRFIFAKHPKGKQ